MNMSISAINALSFKGQNGYENPVNRKTEKNLAILGGVGASALAGGTVFGLTTCFLDKAMKNRYAIAGLLGAGAAAVTAALMLPSAVYNAKVNAFTKEKEMDVFSVKKDAQANIFDEVNKQVQDQDVTLKEKINNFATVSMATNGSGIMLKSA